MSFPRFAPKSPLPDCSPANSAKAANSTPKLAGLAATQSQTTGTPTDDPYRSAASEHSAWARDATADSRHPLISSEVRVKVEAIEIEARAKGWPAELLWNAGFWDRPRGLAAVLDAEDEIVEVAPDCIAILKVRRDVLRFRRHIT
jgi:hypothetical protein